MSPGHNTSEVTRGNLQQSRAMTIFLASVVIAILGGILSWAGSSFATNDRVDGVESQVSTMREDFREMRREVNQKLDTLLLKSK